jgi:hypothetical protein
MYEEERHGREPGPQNSRAVVVPSVRWLLWHGASP